MYTKLKEIYIEIFVEKVFSHRKTHYTLMYIYDYEICESSYLNNRKIEDIEKILFLANDYILNKYNKPMLKYKTYISRDKIYLKYLSDLLRVMPITTGGADPFGKDMKEGRIYEYAKTIKKFSKFSDEELDKTIREKYSKENFNEKYIVKGLYRSVLMRLLARHVAWEYTHLLTALKSTLAWLSLVLLISWIIYGLALWLSLFNITLGILDINIIQFIFYTIITVIPWSLWTLKVIKPTKFEMENNYSND